MIRSQEQRPTEAPQIRRCRRPRKCQSTVGFVLLVSNDFLFYVFVRSSKNRSGLVSKILVGLRDAFFLGGRTCRHPTLPGHAAPLPSRVPPRPGRPVICPVLYFANLRINFQLFLDTPLMKSIYKTKKAAVHWSATKHEERPSSR